MSQNVCQQVSIVVDGSCLGNPGVGGWAAILQCGEHEKELVGSADHTTNNRMKLTAVLQRLQALKRPCQVTILTDSQYVVTILSGGKAKANLDLVTEVRTQIGLHEVTVQKVRGHSGHVLNERADVLAQAAARRWQEA